MEPNNNGLTRSIAEYVSASVDQPSPDYLLQHAALAFLDWFGVTVAAKDEPLVQKLMSYAEALGGHEQATVVGWGRKTSVTQAALVNGAMSHALDYDDNLRFFMGHPSVSLVPSILAVVEREGLSGREALEAFLVGLKAGVWVSLATGVDHYRIGFHGTSTIGRQAAAAACARLLRLDAEKTAYAFGIAGTLANGVKRSFGTMCKPLHAGVAAEGGVQAAYLAREGFDSAADIYEGPLGFFATHTGGNLPVDQDFLDGKHPVEELELKFHAACFCVHAPINVGQALIREAGAHAQDIERMTIDLSQISMDNAGKTELKTGLDGKFSTSYSVANAIITGETGPSGYTDEAVRNVDVLGLMAKTNVRVDPELDAAPLKGRVEITLRDGRTFKGEADPFDDIPDLETKSRKVPEKVFELCQPALGDARARDLQENVLNLAGLDRIDQVMALSTAR